MKSRISGAFALLIALTINAGQAMAQQTENERKELSETRTELSSLRSGNEQTIKFSEDGHKYEIYMKDDKITRFYKDGKEVPEEDYPKYEALVEKVMERIRRDRERAAQDRQRAAVDRERAARDRERAREDREQAVLSRELAAKERLEAQRHREQVRKDREETQLHLERAKKDRQQAEKDRARARVDRERARKDRQQTEDMMNDLVSRKIIESKDALKSLVLDEKEMFVNDKKQPDQVHEHFKTMYLKEGHKKLSYINKEGSRGIRLE